MKNTEDTNERLMKHPGHDTICKPGCVLPNKKVNEKFIYEKLSSTHWTLIVSGKEKIKFQYAQLKICHVPEKTYSFRYILIRPDRHIALTLDSLSEKDVKEYFD